MYTVECYDINDKLVEEPDYFDTYEEACEFAEEMAEHFVVKVICPNGSAFYMG